MWGSKPAPPPPEPMPTGIELEYVGMVVLAHFVLYGISRLIFGTKRYSAPVMGGVGKAKEGSLLAQIVAYNILALAYAVFTAYVGVKAWFYSEEAETLAGAGVQERVYARSTTYELLGRATTSYETYNTIAVLLLPEYRTYAFVGHHTACLLLSLLGQHPFLHYYGLFFFGVASVSSVPLALVEFFTCIGMDAVQDACQIIFALSFLPIRSVYWLPVSYRFWSDSLEAFSWGDGLHSKAALCTFLFANAGLTGLQLFWTSKIVVGIQAKLVGEKSKKT